MKLNANGIEINYEVQGEGPWLTLSHSVACNVAMWDEQMPALTERFRVLRFDTRGHGASGAPPGPYTLEQMADDLHGLYSALGVRETHFVGLSMGGMIGQVYALKYPGVFQSMVLADTTARRPPDAAAMWGERMRVAQAQGMDALVEGTLARWFTEPFRTAQPEVMARFGDYIRNTPVAGFCGCGAAIASIDLLDRLKEIDCPALVMVGDQDHGTPPAMARQIQQHLRAAELAILPYAAHISNVEQADRFNETMLAFLDRVPSRS